MIRITLYGNPVTLYKSLYDYVSEAYVHHCKDEHNSDQKYILKEIAPSESCGITVGHMTQSKASKYGVMPDMIEYVDSQYMLVDGGEDGISYLREEALEDRVYTYLQRQGASKMYSHPSDCCFVCEDRDTAQRYVDRLNGAQ